MRRAAFLIIEVEPAEGISARKLVLETAKYNVLTAHSGKEGLQAFERFPEVDAVVVHHGIADIPAELIAQEVKSKSPKMPVIILSPKGGGKSKWVDHWLSSHDPQALLDLLDGMLERPPQK